MSAQRAFADALRDPARTVPDDLRNPFGGPAGDRFNVYRNTFAAGLGEALETGFPTVRKIVGEAFFRAFAGVFVRAHPPSDPRIATYGSRLPGFLAQFEPVAHLPYLPDVARLDLGLRQSYHAADADSLRVTDLAPEDVMALRPSLAPATLILRSRFPVFDIWRFNVQPDAPKPVPGAQDVLIARPGFDPVPHLLPPGGHTLARHLKGKLTLSEAMTATLAITPDADMAALLTVFLSTGALSPAPTPKDPRS